MPTTEEKERLAEQMRASPTQAECRMAFALLRVSSPFLHQEQHCGYIVDFLNEEHRLAIEVDGTSHRQAWARDRIRDLAMMREGWSVLRVDYRAMDLPDWQGEVAHGLVPDLFERHSYSKQPITILMGASPDRRAFHFKQMRLSSDVSLLIGKLSPVTFWRDEFQPESELFAPDFERGTPRQT